MVKQWHLLADCQVCCGHVQRNLGVSFLRGGNEYGDNGNSFLIVKELVGNLLVLIVFFGIAHQIA